MLCIDAAPNSFLARELAERGGGTATFLTSQPEEEDVTTALDRILEDWSAPVLTGLRLEVNRPGAQAVGRATLPITRNSDTRPGNLRETRHATPDTLSRASAIDIGDLPAGRAVWVAGRIPRGESPDLAFRLLTADGREVAARRCDLNGRSAGPAVKALFGASRVLALEFLTTAYYDEAQIMDQLKRLSYDPADLMPAGEPRKVYAENIQKSAREGLKPLLVREALRYGLACSETAFIAVRMEKGKQVEETAVVANALPSGWDEGFATGAAPMQAFYSGAALPAAPPNINAVHMRAMAGAPAPHRSSPDILLCDVVSNVQSAIPAFLRKASGAPAAASAATPTETKTPAGPMGTPLFTGIPVFQGHEAILIDTARSEDVNKLPAEGTFGRLYVSLGASQQDVNSMNSGLSILIFVDDLASPRARVRLSDIMKQGGVRPLNLRRTAGQVVRIVVEDPNAAWISGAPTMEVTLE